MITTVSKQQKIELLYEMSLNQDTLDYDIQCVECSIRLNFNAFNGFRIYLACYGFTVEGDLNRLPKLDLDLIDDLNTEPGKYVFIDMIESIFEECERYNYEELLEYFNNFQSYYSKYVKEWRNFK